METQKDSEKEVKLIIVRRHDPDEFTHLMLRLAPVYSEWQNTAREDEQTSDNQYVVVERNEP